jgi:uncharacterized protein
VTYLEPQRGDIPTPHPQAGTVRFWEGCAEHRLLFLQCSNCQQPLHAPAIVCTQCFGSDLEWKESSGEGSVYSWTRIWRPQTPAFTVPYVAIIVELDEGWSLLSNLVGCNSDAAAVGIRVQVEFHSVASGVVLPYFRPTEHSKSLNA